MEQVIERLRKSKELEMSLEQTMWMTAGHAWASKTAKVRQLERIAAIDVQHFTEEFSDDTEEERSAILYNLLNAAHPGHEADHFQDMAALIVGHYGEIPTVSQTLGFIEGAQQLWEEVSDKL